MNNAVGSNRREVALRRARLALRVKVCKHCYRRPTGSEAIGADAPRACEAGCRLFTQLPRLVRTAECHDPMVGSFERAMALRIADLCREAVGRDSPCGADRAGGCPLSRFRGRVVRALGMLIRV